MTIELVMSPPVEIGIFNGYTRRCIPIAGGIVSGGFCGSVASGGADWQTIGPNGTLDIDARYILELDTGSVEVESRGLRHGPPDVLARLAKGETVDPSLYYFRTAMRFRSSAPALSRLNHILSISDGERLADRVKLVVYEVA